LHVLYLEKIGGIWIARSTGIELAVIGIMAMLGFVTIPAGMNKHTSNLSHNRMKDNMIGMDQNANNVLSESKEDNTMAMEKMSNMKGM
jgi:hypothetical protein